jgi:hypothetical protein
MEATREQLASLINGKGVKITRGDLWGALQRIPPTGEFATHMGAAPYAQMLLLSILANRECESCNHGDNGGGYSCDCPVPCGARYCQHATESGSGEQDEAGRCPECRMPLTMHHDPGCSQPCGRCETRKGSDAELSAMSALLPALPLVGALGPDARERVMDWARRRACDGLPPF